MKLLSICIVVLALLINLVVASPSWGETHISLVSSPQGFEVGQKVIWLYKARADSTDVQKIPAQVVKISPKQVQIKVRKNNNEYINRWVNPNRLENLPNIHEPTFKSM